MPHGWRIYFVDGGTHREAGEVFLEVLDFWTSFIYPNEIAQGPQSTAKLIGESGETRPG